MTVPGHLFKNSSGQMISFLFYIFWNVKVPHTVCKFVTIYQFQLACPERNKSNVELAIILLVICISAKWDEMENPDNGL